MTIYKISQEKTESYIKKRTKNLYPLIAGLIVITIISFWVLPDPWLVAGIALFAGVIHTFNVYKIVSGLKNDAKDLEVSIDADTIRDQSSFSSGEIKIEHLGYEIVKNEAIKIFSQPNSIYELGSSKSNIFVIPEEIENRDSLLKELEDIVQKNQNSQ